MIKEAIEQLDQVYIILTDHIRNKETQEDITEILSKVDELQNLIGELL